MGTAHQAVGDIYKEAEVFYRMSQPLCEYSNYLIKVFCYLGTFAFMLQKQNHWDLHSLLNVNNSTKYFFTNLQLSGNNIWEVSNDQM